MRSLDRLGSLPAVPLVAAYFALAVVFAETLDRELALALGVGLPVLLGVYCAARPAKGLDVFLLAAFPTATASALGGLAGVEQRWIWLPAAALALVLVAHEDRESAPARRRARRAA